MQDDILPIMGSAHKKNREEKVIVESG